MPLFIKNLIYLFTDLPKRDRPSKTLIKKLYEEDPQMRDMKMIKPPLSVHNSADNEVSVNKECWISIAPDRLSDDVCVILFHHQC